jgi:hypothetical protein
MKRSLIRILLAVYLLLLCLVCFSLSVPPGDLPLCAGMFAVAAAGLALAFRGTRVWRVVWTTALVLAVLGGVLEVVAGKRIAQHRSEAGSRSENVK